MAALKRAAAAGALLAAAAVLVLALTERGASRGPVASSQIQLGANVGRLFNGEIYPPATIDSQLSALRATGVTLARSDAPWEVSEPLPPHDGVHHYDWSFDDEVAGSLAAHGLRWLAIIDYSAPWAQSVPGHDHSPPVSASDYAAYAAAFAARYGGAGSFWRAHPELPQLPVETYEIWNEPDSAVFWYPVPDAARYDQLYLSARSAIEAVQPDARVIVGGLAHPASSIPAMLAASPQLAHQLDGVAIHPYGPTPAAVLDNVRAARAALDTAGLGGLPLYVTEFGWTTGPPGALDYLPESLRPRYIEQTLAALGHLGCGIAAALLYAWITPELNPSDGNDWFGINPPAGGGSADARAFAQGVRAALAPGSRAPCA